MQLLLVEFVHNDDIIIINFYVHIFCFTIAIVQCLLLLWSKMITVLSRRPVQFHDHPVSKQERERGRSLRGMSLHTKMGKNAQWYNIIINIKFLVTKLMYT